MPVDHDKLRALASYSDADTGITERFERLELRSGATFAVVASPVAAVPSTGWVLCHSFAREQAVLAAAEATLARRLAAAGHQVLRFHGQGYGDSEHPEFRATVRTHLEDTEDAVRWFASSAGPERVGLIGFRFGAAVAALAAEGLGLSDLVMIAPTVNGRRYMDEIVRGLVMSRMTTGSKAFGPGGAEDLRSVLDRDGFLDYKGYRLTREVIEENAGYDLATDLERFDGRALILQVSVSERMQGGVRQLAERLGGIGAEVSTAILQDQQAALFGIRHVRIFPPDQTGDVFTVLYGDIAGAVVDWARSSAGAAPEGAP